MYYIEKNKEDVRTYGPDHVQLRIFNILGKKLIIHSSHLQLIIFILESDSRIFTHNFLSKMKCFDIFQALKMSETLIKHIFKNYDSCLTLIFIVFIFFMNLK